MIFILSPRMLPSIWRWNSFDNRSSLDQWSIAPGIRTSNFPHSRQTLPYVKRGLTSDEGSGVCLQTTSLVGFVGYLLPGNCVCVWVLFCLFMWLVRVMFMCVCFV